MLGDAVGTASNLRDMRETRHRRRHENHPQEPAPLLDVATSRSHLVSLMMDTETIAKALNV